MMILNQQSLTRLLLTPAIALALMALVPGCGGDGEEVAATVQPAPPVAPRFASAESLLEYFNSLNTATPVRPSEIVDLYYPENAHQERLVRISRDWCAAMELATAPVEYFGQDTIDEFERNLERRYGVSIEAVVGSPQMQPRPNQPAVISERVEGYVLCKYRDGFGDLHTLYLAERGNRWWISGYTLEYENKLSPEELEQWDQHAREAAAISHNLLPRLRADEFRTFEEFVAASVRLASGPRH